MTRYALMAYAFGFMGFSLVKVLVTGFFSREDSRTPVRCAVISLAVAMLGNLVFVGGFVWQGWAAPHVGLALGTSLGAFVNAGLLYRYLRRDDAYRPAPGWARLSGCVLAASVAMSALLLFGMADLPLWLARNAGQRVFWLLLWIGAAVLVYFAVLALLGVRPRHFRLPQAVAAQQGG